MESERHFMISGREVSETEFLQYVNDMQRRMNRRLLWTLVVMALIMVSRPIYELIKHHAG